MTRARLFIPALAFVTFSGATPMAQHWPHWRGPTHDGVSLETNLPVSWGAECKPESQAAEPAPTSGSSDQGAATSTAGPRARPRSACRGTPPRLDRLQGLRHEERRLEAAASGLQRLDADHLGQHDLPERRHRDEHRLDRAVGDRSQQARGEVEAPARRRQPHAAQAEHVVPVAGHRRQARLGDDGVRRLQGVRLRRQRNLVARSAGRLREVRAEPWIRVVAAASARRALRAGAARDEDRRPVVRPQDRQDDGQDGVARRKADAGCQRISRLLHDAGVGRGQRPRGADHHGRRRRVRPRSGDGQGVLARRRPQSDERAPPTGSSRHPRSSTA